MVREKLYFLNLENFFGPYIFTTANFTIDFYPKKKKKKHDYFFINAC